ncbi:ABC transporter permease [Paenibacillus sp. J5C_2022]|uniref:ABC transporter permease n=1 Tax=Paenibacillus sp. J5C2022 TaxID=2977129 RepID=UPI0021D28D00|nr:ABC transporter permease [Paenibacillus sp. J5C2022]MCU6709625.1 ABC transporter permease [Paenibacillus sp. J5C2022]
MEAMGATEKRGRSLAPNESVTLFMKEWAILFIFIGLFAACSIFVDGFFDSNNIINIVRQISFLAIIALGQFFVVLIGGIDMSAGSSIGFTSVLLAGLVHWNDVPIVLAVVIVLGASIAVGFVNGLLAVYGKIPAFIATLVTMIVLKGVNYLYSNSIPISGLPSGFKVLGAGYVGPIPVPVIILIVIAAVLYVFTMHTATGRSIYAVGGNEEASRLSGINTNRIKMISFLLGSFLTAIGAILITSRTMAGQPTIGENMLFDVITVVVLGGTSLSGGRGKVIGVVIAALILGIIDNAMVLLGIGSYWQWIIKGLILAIVVLIDAKTKKE